MAGYIAELLRPQPVFDRVIARLGGRGNLPEFPSRQPGTVHFLSYDYDPSAQPEDGVIRPLAFREEYCTAIHKVQVAFSNITLPQSNVYKTAIERALYSDRAYEMVPL